MLRNRLDYKIIKKSRLNDGPFFKNCDSEINDILCSLNGRRDFAEQLLLSAYEFGYSRKVFVGGLPRDITEGELIDIFKPFGHLEVDWPYKKQLQEFVLPKGFAFLLFDDVRSVKLLIKECRTVKITEGSGQRDENIFYRIPSAKFNNKRVQIMEWNLVYTNKIFAPIVFLNPRETVFVGAVPRTLTAVDLGNLMTKFFGPVTYVGIDLDPIYKYPKGAARVTFLNHYSYLLAIHVRFITIGNKNLVNKMMEIKPYVLSNQKCDLCNGEFDPNEFAQYFCPEPSCLTYHCESCFKAWHNNEMKYHKPMLKVPSVVKASINGA